MKTHITPQQVKSQLQAVAKIAPNNPSIPILSHILFRAENGTLTLHATDLDQALTTSVEVEVEQPGAWAVPKKILDVLSSLPASDTVSLTVADGRMEIKYKQGKTSLSVQGADEFPIPYAVEGGVSWKVPFDSRVVSFAVAANSTQPAFTCVGLNLGEGWAAGTDTHKVAMQRFEPVLDGGVYLVPAKWFGGLPVGADMQFGGNMAMAEYGGFIHTARLMEGAYPDVKKVIPGEFTCRVTVKRGDILRAIERAVGLVGAAKRGTKSALISMEFKEDKIALSGNTETSGIDEEIPCTTQGDPLTVHYNGYILADVLRAAGDGDVVLGLNGALAPCVVNPGEPWCGLALPVRHG